MARGRRLNSLSDFERSLKNRYGIGAGSTYKPWLRVQDVPSLGHSAKIWGIKTARNHHLLSEAETCLFYLAEFSDNVIDIREQFPLLPLDLSLRIAKTLDLKHPVIPKTKTPSVMTTDFVLTCRDGNRTWYEAVSVKPTEQLSVLRSAEKLDIERIWWQLLGVPFHIFTMDERNQIKSRNIQWITSSKRRKTEIPESAANFILSNLTTGTFLIKELCQELASLTSLTTDETLTILKYLLSDKYILVDLTKPIAAMGTINITKILDASMVNNRAC